MATEDEIQKAIDDDPTLNKKRWQNRRRMAWLSLISMTVITYLILFTNWVPDERMKILGDVITWYYFCSVSVVGAYMGVTAWMARK